MRLIPSFAKGNKRQPRRRVLNRTRRRLVAAAVGVAVVAGGGSAVRMAIESGWLERQTALIRSHTLTATADAGLAVHEVLVRGRHVTSRDELIASLDIHRGMPILAIDMAQTRQRVEALGWVKSAVLARRLPDTIFVEIEERHALALWQHNGRIALIDRDGTVIQRHKLEGYAGLPLVVGEDAPQHAAPLLDLLRTYPAVAGQVEAAVRVSGRRWNLRLRNGVDIRLPAHDIATALDRLAAYQREYALFDRDVIAVDLRVPNRLIVRVSGEAAKRARAVGENT